MCQRHRCRHRRCRRRRWNFWHTFLLAAATGCANTVKHSNTHTAERLLRHQKLFRCIQFSSLFNFDSNDWGNAFASEERERASESRKCAVCTQRAHRTPSKYAGEGVVVRDECTFWQIILYSSVWHQNRIDENFDDFFPSVKSWKSREFRTILIIIFYLRAVCIRFHELFPLLQFWVRVLLMCWHFATHQRIHSCNQESKDVRFLKSKAIHLRHLFIIAKFIYQHFCFALCCLYGIQMEMTDYVQLCIPYGIRWRMYRCQVNSFR